MAGSVTPASTDWQRWKDFILHYRLQRVNIGDYYHTHAPDHLPGEVKAAEIEKTMNNLLEDWVNSGALVLPSGRKISEYEFRLEDKIATNDRSVFNMVWFTDRKMSVSGILLRCMGETLNERIAWVGWKYMLQEIVNVMNGVGGATPIKDAAGNTVGFAH